MDLQKWLFRNVTKRCVIVGGYQFLWHLCVRRMCIRVAYKEEKRFGVGLLVRIVGL